MKRMLPLVLLVVLSFPASAQDLSPLMLEAPMESAAERSPVIASVDLSGDDHGYMAAYYFQLNQYHMARFAVSNPVAVTNLIAMASGVYAGAWAPDGVGGPGYIFELAVVASAWYLFRRVISTGQVTMMGPASLPSGWGWTGMHYSFALGVLYAVATNCGGLNQLYRIDTQTGATVLLAALTGAVCLISLAIGMGSYGLALDTELDRLFRIDLVALTMTALTLSIGYNTGFAQGMGFSVPLGRYFLGTIETPRAAGGAGGPVGQLRMADVDAGGEPTGSTTLLGNLGGGGVEAFYVTFPPPPGTSGESASEAPSSFSLSEVHPNPFYPESVVHLRLDRPEHVRVEMFDRLGRSVARLHEGVIGAGAPHYFRLDAAALPAGLYLVRVTGESFSATRKALLAR
jgi:hypothetical protein